MSATSGISIEVHYGRILFVSRNAKFSTGFVLAVISFCIILSLQKLFVCVYAFPYLYREVSCILASLVVCLDRQTRRLMHLLAYFGKLYDTRSMQRQRQRQLSNSLVIHCVHMGFSYILSLFVPICITEPFLLSCSPISVQVIRNIFRFPCDFLWNFYSFRHIRVRLYVDVSW